MPGSTADHRRLLFAILRRHRLAPPAADAVRSTGVRLRDETVRYHQEYGALRDAETGEQLGDVVTGGDDRLELAPLLRIMIPGRRYVCVHTHPEDASFSPSDVGLLVRFDAICAVVAVGIGGTWYVASFDPSQSIPSPTEVANAYRECYESTLAKYVAMRAEGAMTRRQAARAHTHEIWERAGPTLGLWYARIETGRAAGSR